MKNIISAGSVIALGFVGAATPLVALPANAATATECATPSSASFSGDFDNWYQTCVPQYGAGKVEFTISSDVDFPEGFKDLDDPSVTVTTTADLDDINAYFELTGTGNEVSSPFAALDRIDDDSDPKVQRYSAANYIAEPSAFAAFKITSVSEVTVAELPAACAEFGSPYGRAFSVTFEPLDVTFTQTVNGEEWKFHIVMTPQTQFVGGTIEVGTSFWDADKPVCAAQGEFFRGGSDDSGGVEGAWPRTVFEFGSVNPYATLDSDFVDDYPRAMAQLPETGVSSSSMLGWSSALLAAGGLAFALRRRRA